MTNIQFLRNAAVFLIAFIVWSGQVLSNQKGVMVRTLETGQEFIVAEDKSFPICSIYLIFKTGTVLEKPEQEGLMSLMGEMLTRGTKGRTRDQIRNALDQMGAEISVDADYESMMISGQTLTKNLDAFLEIFSDVVLNPTFEAKEFEKLVRETVAELRQTRENDQFLAGYFFKKELFKKHPYALYPDGRESTVQKITPKEIKEFYKKYLIKENILFAANGDMDADTIERKLASHFKDIPQGKALYVSYPSLPKVEGKHVFLVDKPERTQTQIIIGHLGIDILHPDFFPLMVANNAFGGGFTARLMHEVRVKRGWSYGAYSWYRPRKKPGEFAMLAFPASKDTLDTLKLMMQLYEEYAQKGLTQEEFLRSKNNLINEFPFKIDTARKRMSQLITIELMGLPKDYLQTYRDNLKKVTLEETNKVIQKHSNPKNLVITIVCTAKEFRDKLKSIDKDFKITVRDFRSE